MNKIFTKCISAYLIAALAFGYTAVYAFDDDDNWGDFDASVPLDTFIPEPLPPDEPEPMQSIPSPQPQASEFRSDPGEEFSSAPDPVFEESDSGPDMPAFGSFDLDEAYSTAGAVDQSSVNFIRVVRHPRQALSDYQNAVIEGLQVSIDENPNVADEIMVTCYFIFRDKPTSYFYDINRKEKKLVFEFVDTRTGSSPIAALEQSPIREIVIDEMQVDANKDIKGLNPEWHDMIRITFRLDDMPVFSVTDESNIISFKYKWTRKPENIPQYLEKDRFPMVFWLSAGALGAIGISTLTYFLLQKEPTPPDPTLRPYPLPDRPTIQSSGAASKKRGGR